MEINDTAKIRSHCLKLLARREHSRLELKAKMLAKGYSSAICDVVLDGLVEENFQSDSRFADYYARQRMAKGYGPVTIKIELKQRGISDFPLNKLAEDEFNGWSKLLHKTYAKKYGANIWGSQQEKFKRMRFLQTKGFPSDLIQGFFNTSERNQTVCSDVDDFL